MSGVEVRIRQIRRRAAGGATHWGTGAMSPIGFSLRCPHCFEWSDWPGEHPRTYVLQSEGERQEVIERLQRDLHGFADSRMLRCQSPSGDCPAPFEAFICPDRESAHAFVEKIPTWALRRAFRLYKLNHHSRWEAYSGVMFCTRPVPRQRHLELENLLDRELLSRAIVGMAAELHSPITVYAARHFEIGQETHKFWIPMEAYNPGRPHIPPRYNLFCEECREATIDVLLKEFDGKASTEACPVNFGRDGLCAGREPACEKADWNHCPAFLDARRKLRLCYWSDVTIIDELERKWASGNVEHPKAECRYCWAGFREIAVPVVVHDHLVAVAMSGQIVMDKNKLRSVDQLVGAYPVLASHKDRLESLVCLLRGERDAADSGEAYTRSFCLTRKAFGQRAHLLQSNAARIASAATAHYRHARARREAAFRQELLSHLKAPPAGAAWYEHLHLTMLARMRDFWAFKAAYLLHCAHRSGRLSVVAFSHQSARGGVFLEGKKPLGTVNVSLKQTHPLPWLFDLRGKDGPPSAWVRRFGAIFTKAQSDPDLQLPRGRAYFLVSIPFADETYAFVFAVRDEEAVSPLRLLLDAGVSDMCQEAILETTTAVARELRDVSQRIAREQQIKFDAWRRLSERVAHKIGNRVFAALGALRRLSRASASGSDEVLSKLRRCLAQIDSTCDDLKRFSRHRPAQFAPVDVAALIREEVQERQGDFGDRVVDVDIASDLPPCTWDREQIRYAIGELLDNACHHTPDSGTLCINVHRVGQQDLAEIQVLIMNTGSGIEASIKDKVFEPFFTTRPQGSGLGLSIVDQIVRQHDGNIREDGQPGQYTRFVIELPVHPGAE